MRIVVFFTLILLTTGSFAAKLRIGTPDYSPPFVISIDYEHHYAGFDIDIMSQICRRINRECEYIHTPLVEQFIAVEQNIVDVAIGNIIITPAREQQFLFSLPYLESYGQFLTKSSYNINTTKDIAGKTVGLEQFTAFEHLVKQLFGNTVKIKIYDRLASVLDALNVHEIDVAIINQPTAEVWYANSNGVLALVGKPIQHGLGYGIMAALTSTALIDEINQALLSMEADGTYISIYSVYFGTMGANSP